MNIYVLPLLYCSISKAIKIAESCNLKSKCIEKIIHAVGPALSKDEKPSEKQKNELKSCYLESLKLAVQHKLKSIVFPTISTGIYGFPIEDSAPIVFDAISKYFECYMEEAHKRAAKKC